MSKVRWGVLSTAKIGTKKVIPGMQNGAYCEVSAIASRNLAKARAAASELGIAKAYGSYEALLEDPEIDAIYNPLPNHMHVPWSIKAIEAGKHVLCEKPIGMTAEEGQKLLEAARKRPELRVMEAFMYRHHPQWQKARQIVRDGGIGRPVSIQTWFSYFNDNADDIRNKPEFGGGSLMDIGCYPISLSRFIFEGEPRRVMGCVTIDDQFKTDTVTSAIIDFGGITSTFTCSTKATPYQRVQIYGTTGRIEIKIPFNAPPDEPCILYHETDDEIQEVKVPIADQYTIQGDLMSKAILDESPTPTPLTDAIANMRVIEAIFRSGKSGKWETIKDLAD